MLAMRYDHVHSNNVVYTSIRATKLLAKRPSVINDCFNPLFFICVTLWRGFATTIKCTYRKHRLSNVLSDLSQKRANFRA